MLIFLSEAVKHHINTYKWQQTQFQRDAYVVYLPLQTPVLLTIISYIGSFQRGALQSKTGLASFVNLKVRFSVLQKWLSLYVDEPPL